MEGQIIVRSADHNHMIMDVNVWDLVLLYVLTKGLYIDPHDIKLFIDKEEIPKPENMKDTA